MKLSEMKIRNAKPRAKAYKLGDGDGLFLLVKPTGHKYWRMKYYFEDKEKLLSIGTYRKSHSQRLVRNAMRQGSSS